MVPPDSASRTPALTTAVFGLSVYHCAAAGFPLIGDPVYGGRLKLPAGASEELKTLLREFPRQALHARKLAFLHPASGEPVEFRAALPDDLLLLIDYLRDDHEAMR